MTEKKSSQRFHSLNTEQVEVLHQVLSEVVPIHGRGNFPTLELRPRDIIIAVRARLQSQGITVRDVRLNGSTASHVLVRDNGSSYKDLDIIFGVELPSQEEFQVIKESVLGCLLDCLPAGVNRERISSGTMKEAYVQKMVKVFNEHDRWSLISLSNNSGKNLELKFVSVLRRQFEFSVDSFQIILDRLLESYMQQDAQHKMNTLQLKDHPADSQSKACPSVLKQTTPADTQKSTGADFTNEKGAQTQQREEVQEKEKTEQLNPEKQAEVEEEKTSTGPEEVSEHKENLNKAEQTSADISPEKKQNCEETEPPTQIELRQEPERVEKSDSSVTHEQPEQTERCDAQQPAHSDRAELSVQKEADSHTKRPDEQRALTGQMGHCDTADTEETGSAENPDKSDLSARLREDQRGNEADKTSPDASSCAQMETQSEDEREVQTEIEAETKNEAEMSEITEELSASEDKHGEDTQSIDCSCNAEEPPEAQSTQSTENSEEAADSPPQDVSPTPPGLVSDKKTSSSPSGKVSERLSFMVVLKHSSPKPPRRMCRKASPSPFPDANLCPAPDSGIVCDLKSGPTVPEPHPSSNPPPSPDFTSASAPAPVTDPTLVLPQEPSSPQTVAESSREAGQEETLDTDVVGDQQGQSSPSLSETVSDLEPSERVDPAHPADEAQVRITTKSGVNPQETSAVTCLNPPVLSLSPPCFTPSPPSLSPPPCVTPPSPIMNTTSPTASFSSAPLSFSPTSSCLSSPPYLTPPMLSLSPPPACLTPPSPCLSPPLLCLTPPVESEDLVPQVTSDSLMLNADRDGQLEAGEPPSDKKEDFTPSSPQSASFPITIPSSNSHVLPQPQSGGSEECAPPNATEASVSVPESQEDPKASADVSEGCGAPPPSDSAPAVEVLAESMYGDFEAAMDHLRYRLIATRNPEEIRGGGLLKYSNLLVRDYRPASETQIKTLERYMCSRFFIDFPDVQEQQRKILSYLKNHFIGEERSKYQYLMTLRRVIDDSTVCLMGHERRQTLNMITVLALKVLGEQNIIPNTDHVTCFYQPAPYLAEHSAPYLAEPSYCSYYIPQGGSTLLYQPYPLHLHPQTGLV